MGHTHDFVPTFLLPQSARKLSVAELHPRSKTPLFNGSNTSTTSEIRMPSQAFGQPIVRGFPPQPQPGQIAALDHHEVVHVARKIER